jgi:hypothetical protein
VACSVQRRPKDTTLSIPKESYEPHSSATYCNVRGCPEVLPKVTMQYKLILLTILRDVELIACDITGHVERFRMVEDVA